MMIAGRQSGPWIHYGLHDYIEEYDLHDAEVAISRLTYEMRNGISIVEAMKKHIQVNISLGTEVAQVEQA